MEVAQYEAVFAEGGDRASGHGATRPVSTSVLPARGRGRVTVSAVREALSLTTTAAGRTPLLPQTETFLC